MVIKKRRMARKLKKKIVFVTGTRADYGKLKSIIKIVILCLILIGVIFLLDKVNFPSPENQIKKDITNEIIKLK